MKTPLDYRLCLPFRGERGRDTYRFTAAFDGKTSKFRIKQLEEAGVTHPDMEKIKALLTTEAGQ